MLAVVRHGADRRQPITFHDLGGPFACHGTQATGVYSWRVSGKR